MNTDELFSGDLPNKLSKEEIHELLRKMHEGSLKARDELIVHNIKLVLHEVLVKFNGFDYDKKDLISSGNIGLIRAVDTYDMSKGVEFSTYAVRCIDNEILYFMRSQRKHEGIDSINRVFFVSEDGTYEFAIVDTISDDVDLVYDYEVSEEHKIVKQLVDNLPESCKMPILLYFGFFNNQVYSQKEIAEVLQLSQSHVSKLINKGLKIIGNQLDNLGVFSIKNSLINKPKSKRCDSKTLFELLSDYSHDEIMAILPELSCEEAELIRFRFGDDLDNPVFRSFNEEQRARFYNYLIPKLKRKLNQKRKNNQHLKMLKK